MKPSSPWSPLMTDPAAEAKTSISADCDEGVDPFGPESGDELVGAVPLDPTAVGELLAPPERIAAVGGPEDGATEVCDAADRVGIERHDAVLVQQPVIAAPDTDALPAAVDRSEHGPADHGVQPRGVAAAGGDRDSQRAGGAVC